MMRVVTDAGELRDAMRRVARSGSGYTNNFFASAADTERWVASGALSLMQVEGALLILCRDLNFQRLYHVASDSAVLSKALAALEITTSTIVTDLVGKQESLEAPVHAHIENAFAPYTRLIRMTRLVEAPGDIGQIEPDVVQAERCDVPRIHLLMNKQLDPFSEQIPTVNQLYDVVSRGTVLVVRHAPELGGVLIYDTTGLTTILRYWHIGEAFRNQGVGSRLIRTFFHLCRDSRRILLWVVEGNENAISKYRYYGFRDDSLVDNIMVRKAGLAQ